MEKSLVEEMLDFATLLSKVDSEATRNYIMMLAAYTVLNNYKIKKEEE